MHLGTKIHKGDIYWATPEEKRSSIPHPHVIVQEDVFNHSRIETVIVCAISTNHSRLSEPGTILLDENEGNLPKRSIVVASQISSIPKGKLGEKIGRLSQERVDEVVSALGFIQRSYCHGQ